MLPLYLCLLFACGGQDLSIGETSRATWTGEILPSGDGALIQLTDSPVQPAGNNYENANDGWPCDGTSTYNYTTTIGYSDTYEIKVIDVPINEIITQIRVYYCVSKHNGGNNDGHPSNVQFFYDWQGVRHLGATRSLDNTTPVETVTAFTGLNLQVKVNSHLYVGAVYTGCTGAGCTSNGMRLSSERVYLEY